MNALWKLAFLFSLVAQAVWASPGNTWSTRKECVSSVAEAYVGGFLPHVEYRPVYTGLRSKMDTSLEVRPLGSHACALMAVAGGETRWVYQSPARQVRIRDGKPAFLEECGNPIREVVYLEFNQDDGRRDSHEVVPVASEQEDFFAREERLYGTTTATLSGMSTTTSSGGAVVQQQDGMGTGGVVAIAAVTGGLVYLASRGNDGDEITNITTTTNTTNTNTTTNNTGLCAGATVIIDGNGNAVCSTVTTTTTTNTQPTVCNAPDRIIGGVCTAPPTCRGMEVLDQTFTCQCVSPNRVFSNGMCETPRQCNAGETLGPDNVCRTNEQQCRSDQISVGTTCQCPVWQSEVNGRCQALPPVCTVTGQTPVNGVCQCPSGHEVVNNMCQRPPPICTITGQVVVGNVCQCPNGLEVRDGACRMPIEYCPDGTPRPANGQCYTPPPPEFCTMTGRPELPGQCPPAVYCPDGSLQTVGRICPYVPPPPEFCTSTGTMVPPGQCPAQTFCPDGSPRPPGGQCYVPPPPEFPNGG